MKQAIIIPARYHSSRLPGKPLMEINGIPMLERVVNIAKQAAQGQNTPVVVTSEDARILEFAETLGVLAIETSEACRNGTHRVFEAAKQMPERPDIIVNLQGDAPMTPVHFIGLIFDQLRRGDAVATIGVRLSWDKLWELQQQKLDSPFSGTTAIVDTEGWALWFSKNIIPALRKVDRDVDPSPVIRHVGLYGYQFSSLQRFLELPPSHYEQIESLEQLRFIENRIPIRLVESTYGDGPNMSGIDTLEDLERATVLFREYEATAD